MLGRGSLADQFQALSSVQQCECALLACELALEPWESLCPEEGQSFTLPDALVFGRLDRSFGRSALEATTLHRDRLGHPMETPIEQLCLDLDLAIVHDEVTFDEPALQWAAFAFSNLVLAAVGKQTWVSDEIPHRNPFLLSVNQAITALAFFRMRNESTRQDWSPSSIDSHLLSAIVKDWWERCEAALRATDNPGAVAGPARELGSAGRAAPAGEVARALVDAGIPDGSLAAFDPLLRGGVDPDAPWPCSRGDRRR